MSTTTVHGRIQRERVLHHVFAPLTTLAVAFYQWALHGVLALQASQSAHAQAMRLLHETAEARSLAQQHAKTDPGFSADLLAAVARHESAYTRQA